MVDWDEIKKELKKLMPERALEYLEYLQETVKDREILAKIKEESEHIKEVISQKKDWKKIVDITPISRDVEKELIEMARERPVRKELDLEKAVEIMERDLKPKEEEKGVEYNKGGGDYGQYLSERIDISYSKPDSTFDREQLIQNPERRYIELIEQQRKGGYHETKTHEKKEEKEEFKYETKVDNYKRKKE